MCPQEARLLATKEGRANGHQLYLVDYGLKKPGEEEERIFLTSVCLGFNGRYGRLIFGCQAREPVPLQLRSRLKSIRNGVSKSFVFHAIMNACRSVSTYVRLCNYRDEHAFIDDFSCHRYNRLYTLTAQSMASNFSANESLLRNVISSFKPPAPVV